MRRDEELIYKQNLEKRFANVARHTYTREINFDNGMTAAAMQAMIDACHKCIPYGAILSFQFADGTYAMAAALTWSGFYGGGTLEIKGNLGDGTSLSTTQSVYLDFSGQDCNGLYLQYNRLGYIRMRNLKIRVKSTVGNNYAVRIIHSPCYHMFYYGYILGTGATKSFALDASNFSSIGIYKTYFSNIQYAIRTNMMSHIHSDNNDDTGVQPQYGLTALRASLIGKTSTQPAGSVANESSSGGGEIR